MIRLLLGGLSFVFLAASVACSSEAPADSPDHEADDRDDDAGGASSTRSDASARDDGDETPHADAGNDTGECAVDCQGGACTDGICQPLVLRTSFYADSWALADSGNLYYADTDGYVFRFGDTEADDEAIGDEPVDRIVAADEEVIWAIKGHTVVALPLDGGAPEVRVEAAETLWSLAVNSTRVFWAAVSQSQRITVHSSPIDATPPYVGTTWADPLVADGFAAANDEHVYYRAGSGGTSDFHRVGVDGTGDEVLFSQIALSNVQIVGDELYFIAYDKTVGDTVLEHAQLDGSNRTRIWEGVFGSAGDNAYYGGSFVVTPHAVYWSKGKSSELVRLAR